MSFPNSSSASFQAVAQHLGSSFRTLRPPPPKRKRSNSKELEIPETPCRSNVVIPSTPAEKLELTGRFKNMQLADSVVEETAFVFDDDVDMMMMEGLERRSAFKRRCEGDRNDLESGDGIGRLAPRKQVRISPPVDEEETEEPPTPTRRRLRSPPPSVEIPEENKPEEDEELSSDPDQYGIAYIPTASQRYARSQRRIQQIREYKTRESREAREKRSAERRRRKSQSRADAAHAAAMAKFTAKKKAVRFTL